METKTSVNRVATCHPHGMKKGKRGYSSIMTSVMGMALLSACANLPQFLNPMPTVARGDLLPVRDFAAGRSNTPRPPKEFTAEEKKLFVEAVGRLPRKAMPPLWPDDGDVAGFLDGRLLLVSVRELPSQWQAQRDELSRVVAVDTDTGNIEDTGYRGELLCVSPQRLIVRDYQTPFVTYVKPGDPVDATRRLAVGKFGEPLEKIKWPENHVLINIGCQLAIPRDLPVDRNLRYSPLLGKDGTVVDDWNLPGGMKWSLVDGNGKILFTIPFSQGRAPVPGEMFHLPWMNAYYARDAVGRPSPVQIFTPQGDYQSIPPPKLIAQMVERNMGSAVAWVLRNGLLWEFIAHTGFYKRQGLYWQRGDKLWRVEDGAIVVRQALSLDGCRLYYGRIDGDSARLSSFKNKLQNYVIDFCQDSSRD